MSEIHTWQNLDLPSGYFLGEDMSHEATAGGIIIPTNTRETERIVEVITIGNSIPRITKPVQRKILNKLINITDPTEEQIPCCLAAELVKGGVKVANIQEFRNLVLAIAWTQARWSDPGTVGDLLAVGDLVFTYGGTEVKYRNKKLFRFTLQAVRGWGKLKEPLKKKT